MADRHAAERARAPQADARAVVGAGVDQQHVGRERAREHGQLLRQGRGGWIPARRADPPRHVRRQVAGRRAASRVPAVSGGPRFHRGAVPRHRVRGCRPRPSPVVPQDDRIHGRAGVRGGRRMVRPLLQSAPNSKARWNLAVRPRATPEQRRHCRRCSPGSRPLRREPNRARDPRLSPVAPPRRGPPKKCWWKCLPVVDSSRNPRRRRSTPAAPENLSDRTADKVEDAVLDVAVQRRV